MTNEEIKKEENKIEIKKSMTEEYTEIIGELENAMQKLLVWIKKLN